MEHPARVLVGMRMEMSLSDNRIPEIWRRFMPRRQEIEHRVSEELISMRQHEPGFDIRRFNPATVFHQWAAVEVEKGGKVPEGMEMIEVPEGKYAVFLHRGGPATAGRSYSYIYGEWMPASGYVPAQRPSYEVMGARYGDGGADSEEELWIAIEEEA